MSSPLKIVLCSSNYWDDPPGTPRRITEALAHQHRVLYVEPPASYLYLRMRWRNAAWVRWLRPLRRVQENLFIWTPPPSLPWKTRWRWSNDWTQRLHLPAFRRAIARAGFTRPVVLTFLPHHYELAGRLDAALVCYYCIDEWTALTRFVHPPTIRAYEQTLARRADLVFATAHSLAERLARWNPHVRVVPNGADTELFSRACDPALPLPDEVASLPRPIIGFCGVCDFRLDQELLAAVARARPAWTFLFVGAVATRLGALRGLRNVRFLGHRPPESLPGYLRAFDVAVIPYARNEMTRHIYPVKWNEYLAAGLPVVATPLAELARLAATLPAEGASWLRLAASPQEFLRALECALQPSERAPNVAALRRAWAERNSWQARARVIVQAVEAALDARHHERIAEEETCARTAAIAG
jgi:glycosyltransferase involved in cell wall biosynthesis